MKEVIKSVINTGGYKLADIQYKIKKLYAMGDLDEKQMDELLALAADSVCTDAERPEILAMLKNLSDRISLLEGKFNTEEDVEGSSETARAYETWSPWDGISDKYQSGAIVSHGGKLWISTYTGQNVWEPGTAGIQFWKEYTV